MEVELVTHNPVGALSGIGRYVRELHRHLQPHVAARLVRPVDPPLAKRFSFLHHLPVGLEGHRPGTIVHFTQIMGCAQMLWRPVHPAVATVHDLGVLVCKEDEALFNRFDRWILRLQLAGLKRMDHYAVNSHGTRLSLVEALGMPDRRIHFVPLGVDTAQFRPLDGAGARLEKQYGIRSLEGVSDLLYVGSELPRKNVRLLLEAMAVLKQRGYLLRLIKVGGPGGQRWREESLGQIRAQGLEDNVVFAGTVSDEDLPLFYNASDLSVTATLLEGGFAWLAMEAMACGKPCVVTKAAHVPAEAEEAVTVVPTRNLDALVEAIARCLDDEDMRWHMGAAGRRIITQERYSWKTTARAMTNLYRAASTVMTR